MAELDKKKERKRFKLL